MSATRMTGRCAFLTSIDGSPRRSRLFCTAILQLGLAFAVRTDRSVSVGQLFYRSVQRLATPEGKEKTFGGNLCNHEKRACGYSQHYQSAEVVSLGWRRSGRRSSGGITNRDKATLFDSFKMALSVCRNVPVSNKATICSRK
jgi:hypothetical protein